MNKTPLGRTDATPIEDADLPKESDNRRQTGARILKENTRKPEVELEDPVEKAPKKPFGLHEPRS